MSKQVQVFDYSLVDEYTNLLLDYSRRHSADGGISYSYALGYMSSQIKELLIGNDAAKAKMLEIVQRMERNVENSRKNVA